MKRKLLTLFLALAMVLTMMPAMAFTAFAGEETQDLPAGYTAIDYYEAKGEQYIDTGVKVVDNTNVIMEYQLLSSGNTVHDAYLIFGNQPISSKPRYLFGMEVCNDKKGKNLMFPSGTENLDIYGFDTNKHTVEFGANMSVKIDGVSKRTAITVTYPNNMPNITLFNANNQGTYDTHVKIYSLKILEGTTVVRNFMPCKNDKGKAGLYDLVGKKFYKNEYGTSSEIKDVEISSNNINYQIDKNYNSTNAIYFDSRADLKKVNIKNTSDHSISVNCGNSEIIESQSAKEFNLSAVDSIKIGDYNIYVMQNKTVSSIYIDLKDHNISYLLKQKWNYDTGTITKVSSNGKVEIDKVALAEEGIHGRGNASWSLNNNSSGRVGWSLKLNKKTTLINGAEKCKKYNLVASGIKMPMDIKGQYIAGLFVPFDIYSEIDGSSPIKYEVVNVYIDGEYRGVYLLTEKPKTGGSVDINKTETSQTDEAKRKTVTSSSSGKTEKEQKILDLGIKSFTYAPDTVVEEQGGYVLEITNNPKTTIPGIGSVDSCGFVTKNSNTKIIFDDPDDISIEQMYNVCKYVQEFEDALYSSTGYNSSGKHYSDYFDISSEAKWVAINGLFSQNDAYIGSTKFYIDGDSTGFTSKLTAGPLWDMDYLNQNDKTAIGFDTSRMWINKLVTKGDFVNEICINASALTKAINNKISNTFDTDFAKYKEAVIMNTARYQQDTSNLTKSALNTVYTARIKDYKDWLNKRTNTEWDTYWSDTTNALRGVTASYNAATNTLSANAKGATSYQWYKLKSNYTESELISGATSSTYNPTSDGLYYVKVSGTSLQGENITALISKAVDTTPTKIDYPIAEENLVYDGTEKVGIKEGTGYTLTGNKAKTAGKHTATATLVAGYKWADDSTKAKDIEWTIAKAESTNSGNVIAKEIVCGEKLSNSEISGKVVIKGTTTEVAGKFVWKEPNKVPKVTDTEAVVVFVPTDSDNYDGFETTVTIKVNTVKMIEGMDQKIVEGAKNDATFRSNAAFDTFKEVRVNGTVLDGKNYEVKSGSTIVTLKSDYVSSLKAGKYKVSIVSDGGTADATLTVAAATDTGDNNNIALYIGVAVLALLGIAVMLLRKRAYNK